tara:strand:- start:3359 stop:3535 length:177 start_codon:yes stop_codon:yes gene_type:complete
MTWFYIFWIVGAIGFVASLYLTLRVVDKVINLNTVRINENKKRLEVLEEKIGGSNGES